MVDWTLGRAFRIDGEIRCASCFDDNEVENLGEEDVLFGFEDEQPIVCSTSGETVTEDSQDAYNLLLSWREDGGATRKVG